MCDGGMTYITHSHYSSLTVTLINVVSRISPSYNASTRLESTARQGRLASPSRAFWAVSWEASRAARSAWRSPPWAANLPRASTHAALLTTFHLPGTAFLGDTHCPQSCTPGVPVTVLRKTSRKQNIVTFPGEHRCSGNNNHQQLTQYSHTICPHNEKIHGGEWREGFNRRPFFVLNERLVTLQAAWRSKTE